MQVFEDLGGVAAPQFGLPPEASCPPYWDPTAFSFMGMSFESPIDNGHYIPASTPAHFPISSAATDTAFSSPQPGHSRSSQPSQTPDSPTKSKPKQKRNKPTLSCAECVERKTKCDRGRPKCIACVKRSSKCQYSQVAEFLLHSKSTNVKDKPARGKKRSRPSSESPPSLKSSKHSATSQPQARSATDSPSYSTVTEMPPNKPVHLTSLQMPNSAPINVFEVGAEHPFGNYWTSSGGLKEVIDVLPNKQQADVLMSKYFEIIDPLYPVLDRAELMAGYEQFWALPDEQRAHVDGALLALHLVIYATTTQFIRPFHPSMDPRTTAEFYISAAHQALRISSYWNHITMSTVQAMVMTFYFLINDNHTSDGWVFSGITTRQAHVLQLNRDPTIVVPEASTTEKQLRCLLWSLVVCQDTGVALFLKLPPASDHSDIKPESFSVSAEDAPAYAQHHANYNMRLDSFPVPALTFDAYRANVAFSKSLWQIGKFVQENICKPRSLNLPIVRSLEHKRTLISTFRALYRNFPEPFNSTNPNRFYDPDRRLSRQQIGVASNFYHPMMLLTADENSAGGVSIDVPATLEAAHEVLISFFAMQDVFGDEVNGFWAYQHRAFEAALTMANLLVAESQPQLPSTHSQGGSPLAGPTSSPIIGAAAGVGAGHLVNRAISQSPRSMLPPPAASAPATSNSQSTPWLLATAKDDVRRMLEIIQRSSGYFEFQTMQENRLDALSSVYAKITVI